MLKEEAAAEEEEKSTQVCMLCVSVYVCVDTFVGGRQRQVYKNSIHAQTRSHTHTDTDTLSSVEFLSSFEMRVTSKKKSTKPVNRWWRTEYPYYIKNIQLYLNVV